MNKHKGIVIDALFLCPFFRLFLPILLPFFMLKPIDLWLRKTPRRGYRKVRMATTSKGKGKSGGCRVITLNMVERNGSLCLLYAYDKSSYDNIDLAVIKSLAAEEGLYPLPAQKNNTLAK